MSNATGTPDHQTLLAERFGPGAAPAAETLEASRSSIIAALHAIAFFFVDHLEVPQPRTVNLHCPVADRAALESLAAAHHTVVYGDRPQVSIRLELPGIYVTVIAYVPSPDRPL